MKNIFEKNDFRSVLTVVCGTAFLSVLIFLFFVRFYDFINLFFSACSILSPLFIGLLIAYLLRPIAKSIEKFITSEKLKKHLDKGFISRLAAVILTYVFVALLILAFSLLLFPQLRNSYNDFISKADYYVNETKAFIDRFIETSGLFGEEYSKIEDLFGKESLSEVIADFIGESFDIFSKIGVVTVDIIKSFVIGTYRFALSVIFSFWVLLFKEKTTSIAKRFFSLFMPKRVYGALKDIIVLADKTFGNYLAGNLIDMTFVGILSFVVLAIFKIHYYPLIALVLAVTNIIPYFGPFLGISIGTAILLLPYPFEALLFVVLGILIQQLDGNVIAPRIIGDSVGISSLWVIVTISVMGSLFGLIGMVVGVPLFGVIYELLSRIVNSRLEKKGIKDMAGVREYIDGNKTVKEKNDEKA